MSGIAFDKYEGLGNDFLVIDGAASGIDSMAPTLARRLCDRRFGVGADGVLLVLAPSDPSHLARMKVVNADGSSPEMCGNGLRCVALHVARRTEATHVEGVFETDAGLRTVSLDRTRGHAEIAVDMGEVRIIEERTLELGADGEVRVVVVDAGNPHAILLPTDSEAHDRSILERIGARIERHPAFPKGTNVELVSREQDGVRLTVWERGVGFTLACGTGACATVAALVSRGERREGETVRVHLPGGDLLITMQGGRARMVGPARHVFSGHAP